ncbi:hypothetical protein [Salininema proteolyticum]|uniref:Uncharacterized protein n=1 Tax=Salininema proteolyticum TaxID=1607685 RepID=A0ABV8U416_9ACTN
MFTTRDDLVEWLTHPDRGEETVCRDAAEDFINNGWAPSRYTWNGHVLRGVATFEIGHDECVAHVVARQTT